MSYLNITHHRDTISNKYLNGFESDALFKSPKCQKNTKPWSWYIYLSLFIRMHHQPTALPGFCKSHWVSPERHRACGRPWACDAPGAPSHRDDGFMIDRLPVTKYDLSVLEWRAFLSMNVNDILTESYVDFMGFNDDFMVWMRNLMAFKSDLKTFLWDLES